MVLTTPLLAYLAQTGPVDVVCTPAARRVAREPSGGARDHPSTTSAAPTAARAASSNWHRRLRARAIRAAYLAQGSSRSGALAFAAGIRERVGFATSAGRLFYTTRIPPIENMHHAARLLSLGTRDPLRDVPRERLRPRLYPGDRGARGGRRRARRTRRRRALSRWRRAACGRQSAGRTTPSLRASSATNARIVVVGAEADRPLAAEIVAATSGSAIDATGKLSLLASAELIGRASLLVTNDSAPLHLASAMNTPTVAIFGPTVPEFGFGPLAERSRVAGTTDLGCRPCDRHGPQRCPLGHWRCMREITADDGGSARPTTCSPESRTMSTKKRAAVHHRRRSRRDEHRRRRDVGGRHASTSPCARFRRAPSSARKASPTASSG